MNIDIMSIVFWFSQTKNCLFALVTVCGIMGTLSWAPNVYGRKRIVLIKSTQCLFTGLVGGVVVSISIVTTGIPFILLFIPSLYKKVYPNENTFEFIRLLFTFIPLNTLLKVLLPLFVGSSIIGLLLGLCLGIFSGSVPSTNRTTKNKESLHFTHSHLSWHNFISWCILGCGIGAAFGMTFGFVTGLLSGCFLGLLAFILGLHPKPHQGNTISKRTFIIKSLRIFGFWLIMGFSLLLVLIYLIRLIIISPILSIFFILVLSIFFGFLIKRGTEMEPQQLTIRVVSERDEEGLYRNTRRLVASHRRFRDAFLTGFICGILIYSLALGLPTSFLIGNYLGFEVGVIIEIIFSNLGFGLGVAYGLIFICIYAFGPIIAFYIEQLTEKTLERIGVSLVILSIILGVFIYLIQ